MTPSEGEFCSIARMSTGSLMGFAWGLAVSMEMNIRKMHFRKTELRLRWDLNPGPLLFVYNGHTAELLTYFFKPRTSFVGLRINH